MVDALLFFALLTVAVGFIGSLTGLGGATFLVPIYVLFLGMPIQYAAGASLISTIATSSGAGSAQVRDRLTNVRIGMSLKIATTGGSIVGSLAATWVYTHRLQRVTYILLGVVLLFHIHAGDEVQARVAQPQTPS